MKKFQKIISLIITSLFLISLIAFAEPQATTQTDEEQPAQTEQPLEGSPEPAPANQPLDILELNVNLDGSSSLSYIGFIDEKYHEMLKPQYEQLGYTVETIDQDGAKALKLSKDSSKADPVSFSLPGNDPEDFQALKIPRIFSTMYVVSTRFDMRQYPVDSDLLMLKFNLPVKSAYTNASDVQNGGKLLTWKIHGNATNPIDMVMIVPNVINIVILVLAILILLFLIFIIIYSNKKKKLLENNGELLDSISVDSESEANEDDSEFEDPFESMTVEEIKTDDDTEEDISKDEEIDAEIKDENNEDK